MSIKKLYKVFLVIVVFLILGTIKVHATNDVDVQEDNIAPVFDPNVQTRYILKRADDGSVFNPTKTITGITATDNVDGKNVKIAVAQCGVDLSSDGEYQVLYTATDKAGNTSYLIVTVIVDGRAPTFENNIENLYYINHAGMIFDSKYNIVESLPTSLIATDSLGAYSGIGIYITNDEKGNIIFLNMLKNTPAETVLKTNDTLIRIDGEDIRGKSPDYVASKIKGEEGTVVQLDIIRNGQKMSVSIERQLIKLYDDKECIASPDLTIDSIDTNQNGIIEITYTATDEAGNTSEFVIQVIVIDDATPEGYIQDKAIKETEEFNDVTTSGTPPEDINIEIPLDEETNLEEDMSSTSDNTSNNIENENSISVDTNEASE